jgi:sugar lactone lactonase YvrE
MQRVASAAYAEGPLVLGDELWFVAYEGGAVHARSLASRLPSQLVVPLPPGSGPAGLGVHGEGGDARLAVACYDAHRVVLLDDADRRHSWEVPHPNDLAADGRGGLFVTSSGDGQRGEPFRRGLPPTGSVYHLSRPGARPCQLRLDRPIDYANGVAFDVRAQRLYVAEHFGNRVLSCGPDGRLDTHVQLPRANDDPLLGPDGLAFADGRLYVAHHGVGRVLVYEGQRLVEAWDAPPGHAHVTNVALDRDARRAYVTTAEGGVFERELTKG